MIESSFFFFFFFSSRRRHTRFDCDWSSDVCSSDLDFPQELARALLARVREELRRRRRLHDHATVHEEDSAGHLAREARSEEHTSELQSQSNLVCRLLLEKKKKKKTSKVITNKNIIY